MLPLCQVSVDCWTRKGYKGSFYGETINFYNFDKLCVSQRTLAIGEFCHPHTVKRITEKYKSIHECFGRKPTQISFVFSDSASNMLKAFDILGAETDESPDSNSVLEDSDTDFEQLVCELSMNIISTLWRSNLYKNLTMKLCNIPKFRSTFDLMNNAPALVNTVQKSATLKQE